MRFLSFLVLVIFSFSSGISLAAKGIDPEADTVSIAKVRKKMDEIRKHRPTVGLVLSGGGAKGAAHVGVLQYLESLQIPVDLVVGTSMGGLIGGLYSLGYEVSEIDSLLINMNWRMALSDKVPRNYISYKEAKYKEKYLLAIPFHHAKSPRSRDYYDIREVTIDKVKDKAQFDIGAGGQDATDLLKNNLLRSLPSGYIRGQNINNILSSLTVAYQDSMDFVDLPVPFACVAADLVSGKEKFWHSGQIKHAMRSTMSIPGMFTPVKVDGMVLVDGGMRDNYPTTLAKKMGADIIIGVELSDSPKSYDEINNIGDILIQGIEMLGKDSFEKNILVPNVTIKPNLEGYNMLSFDTASIDTIITRGYEAAVAQDSLLNLVKRNLGPNRYYCSEPKPKAIDIGKDSVMLNQIYISTVTSREAVSLLKRMDIKSETKVTRTMIEHEIAKIFGTNAYSSVNYELLGQEEPYDLHIECRRGPAHQLGVGLRADTEEIVSILINVGFFTRRLHGSSFNFTTRFSANPYFEFLYSYDGMKMPTLNAMASTRYVDMGLWGIGGSKAKMSFFNARQEVFFSNIKWSYFDMKAGLRNDYFNMRSFYSLTPAEYDLRHNDFISLFCDARADTFDNGYFPTMGFTAGFSYAWTFVDFPTQFKNFHATQVDAKVVVPAGEIFAFIPSFNFRFLFGDSAPLPYLNGMGGSMPGRYVSQQIPFYGFSNIAIMNRILTTFRTDLRFNVAKNHYITGIFNYARDSDTFKTYLQGNNTYGAAIEYSYNTFFGPISANLHWSSLTEKVGFYVGIGYNF